MAQAKLNFSDIEIDGSVIKIDFRRNRRRRARLSAEHTGVLVLGASILVTALAMLLLIAAATRAVAQERNAVSGAVAVLADAARGFEVAALPPIDSIDAETDITVFMQHGVPERMRHAALRRAWTADPAIRDFREVAEVDWDFDDLNSIPGFGDIGPEFDVARMVAQILGHEPRIASASSAPSLLRVW